MANDAMWVIYDALHQEQGARPGTVGTLALAREGRGRSIERRACGPL